MMVARGERHLGRERAIQALFSLENVTVSEVGQGLEHFWETVDGAEAHVRDFAEEIVRGVVQERVTLDQIVQEQSANWRLERMARVDRNILRVGAWEILHGGTPTKVAINEAVELAKIYGSEASPAFVNGILDKLARAAGKL